jgi:hypothetical protein
MTQSLCMIGGLLLCHGATAAAQTLPCDAIPVEAKVDVVGAFSNTRYTEEHAYGYEVKLWRAGNCLFGLFESSDGLAGDTPIGVLAAVKHDRRTGTLSFTAKLTTGEVGVPGSSRFEPARDLFSFTGVLRTTRLEGVVTHALRNSPDLRPTTTKAVLRARRGPLDLMRGPKTYGEWRDAWQPALQYRGPKW